ncbi:DNA-binding transcriptional regulator, AcrR family [Pedococcus dokdonensis]|uniref:DNA-binding transcriptional regulator, AcrR family n=1 Tax=Pedococcus dokdonensis TaxID=443156 RepID=A0A1H0QNB7_9MICO|nr:TetR/AcrR family transcriptional regulator [Pedococcus dokdonensis]SDP18249.1 DNA-binding transcriptional regulator, AcrR family [Pedococcus dokdonensis]
MSSADAIPIPSDGGDGCNPLRADAQRNRARVLNAAREAFADQGLEVPMAEVARRAGVGIATLFRRFPTRDDLITAVFSDTMARYSEAVDVALEDPDPWRGFCGYVQQVCAMQAADRGFMKVLTRTFPHDRLFEAERERAFHAFTTLMENAKAAGGLRADFVPQDLAITLMANAGVVSVTGGAAPESSPRIVAYLLQAFAAQAAQPLPPAPTQRRIHRALRLHR